MKIVLILIVTIVTIYSCVNKKTVATKETIQSSIDSVEKVLYATAATAPINKTAGEIAVKTYANYVMKFPLDEKSPGYLFKAGEVASAIKMNKEAIEYFELFVKNYPKNKKAASALFLQAFICENDLQELGRANQIYIQVIEQYPGTNFARDAAASINNLGKSPEDLIKEFEAKNKVNQ